MFIERNGKRIYLTDDELVNASMEYDRECHESDVDEVIDPDNFGIEEWEFRKLRGEIVKEYEALLDEDDRWTELVEQAARNVIEAYKEGPDA